ncbi:MAG: WYL domain-containing protein [Deltaproteobacteria bacterium]|nr:WYL domain-containing protein [Deltaproteobacteria bacterium]
MLLKKLDRPQGATLEELTEALPDDYPKHPRTIRRDIEAIEEVFPLQEEKVDGRTRWKLAFDHKAPPLTFSHTELMALTFCRGMLSGLDGTPVKESLDRAVEKIDATLPDPVKRYVRAHGRMISCGPVPSKDYERHKGTIDTLHRALDERRAVKTRYASQSAGKTSWREVDPYNLRYAAGTFYLVGHCHSRAEVRIFAVDRIKAIELLDRRYEVPEDFDIERYMSPRLRRDARRPRRGRYPPCTQDRRLGLRAHLAPQPEGRQGRRRLRETHPDRPRDPRLKSWILSLGAGAHVLKPHALIVDVFNEAMEIAEGAHFQM